MRIRLILAAFAALTLGMTSCQKDNFGYETTVTFSAEGGEKTVTGDSFVYTLSIGDYAGNEESSNQTLDDALMSVTYQWLSASVVPSSKTITLVAEPNTTGKKRTLYVYGMVQNHSAEIKVVQEK